MFAATALMHAADVKVIANNSVAATSISASDLKDVFLLDKDSLAGNHVEPVLQNAGATHEAFIKEYLGKPNSVLQAFYRSQVFTGKASMPKVTAADTEMVAYVAKTKGAIGYISSSAASEGVKTLLVK
jgi:ABC-type phosphate transport system substrate-binding protein